MTLDGFLSNIEREKQIIKNLFSLKENYLSLTENEEKKIIEKKMSSLISQLKILNNSIPSIIENISFFKELPSSHKSNLKTNVLNISYNNGKEKINVVIDKKDKNKFMNELRIDKNILDRIKTKKITFQEENISYFKQPSFYKKISNRFFLNFSTSLFKKGYFNKLEDSLKKALIPILPNSYLAMAFFSSILSLILGAIFLLVLSKVFLISVIKYLLPVLFLPLITFLGYYFYPLTESQGIGQKIKNELPFVTLHMAAISGSKIEPTQIFKIIAFGKEYPNTKREFIKIINQTNIYGYDLVTALKSVSKSTPSVKLAELLNGIGTAISSGGDITEFLNKRSETLFFEYKMDREKYTKEAETFMDIYISLVIAAPMVLSLLLVLMNIGIMNLGIPMSLLNILMIGGVALINIIFIAFLNLKQVNY